MPEQNFLAPGPKQSEFNTLNATVTALSEQLENIVPKVTTIDRSASLHTWDNRLATFTATHNCLATYSFIIKSDGVTPKKAYTETPQGIHLGNASYVSGIAKLNVNESIAFCGSSQTDGNTTIVAIIEEVYI